MEDPADHTLEELGLILGIPDLFAIQDWELEFADPQRVAEFCDAYETGAFSTDDKAAIMQLIVASYDRHLSGTNPQDDLEARIYNFLKQDFSLHQHTIEYWSNLKSHYPEVLWRVSPLMRRILSERSGGEA